MKTAQDYLNEGYSFWYAYQKGVVKPNYPMPAIRLAVTIDYEFVAIWSVGIGLDYYHDEYETVFTY